MPKNNAIHITAEIKYISIYDMPPSQKAAWEKTQELSNEWIEETESRIREANKTALEDAPDNK